MTTKTPKKARSKPNKSAFVRNLPADMPASDVIEKAKAEGLTLTPAYVYSIRTAARRRSNGGSSLGSGGGSAPVGRRGGGAAATGPGGGGRVEDLLRAVASELGLSRAIAVLQTEQRRVRAVLGD